MDRSYTSDLRAFVVYCITHATRPAWGVSDWLASALGLAGPILLKRYPQWEVAMNDLLWQIPVSVLGVVLLVRILLAPFHLYRKKQDEVDALLVQVDDRSPRLVLRPEQTVTGQTGVETVFVLFLSVINKGEPSIAHEWHMHVVFPDESESDYYPFHADNLGIEIDHGVAEFRRDGMIYEKTQEEPIPRGGARSGALLFRMGQQDRSYVGRARKEIRCRDSNGNLISSLIEDGKPGSVRHHPGIASYRIRWDEPDA